MLAGVALLLLELVLPGGIVGFLGISALLTASLVWMGWIPGFGAALAVWCIVSLALVVLLRRFVMRLIPGSTETGADDIEEGILGARVRVVEAVSRKTGRIVFRGVEWSARVASDVTLPVDAEVRVLERDGVTYLVEPVEG